MSYVLAIESNRDQARALRDTIATSAQAKVLIVESVESAMTAIEREVPRLILVSALLPPKDEGDLVERVRTLPRHVAPEILITPAFPGSERKQKHESAASLRALFGRRQSRNPRPLPAANADFGHQLSAYLSFMEARHSPLGPVAVPEPAPGPPASSAPAPVAPEPSGIDRRASVRIGGVDWATVRINGTPVQVVDLSVTGAQILSPTVLRLGGSVHVMLSRDAELVQCDAGIIWGTFEITQPTSTPLFRAGINFKDADRLAMEQLCMERRHVRPDGPRYEPKDW